MQEKNLIAKLEQGLSKIKVIDAKEVCAIEVADPREFLKMLRVYKSGHNLEPAIMFPGQSVLVSFAAN